MKTMSLQNKKVLVTGADGFIGSHLTERLVKEGCKVKAFVFYNSFGSWGWLDSISDNIKNEIEVVAGDIRDGSNVETATVDSEIIFHLAALISIPFSYISPESFIDTNIKGTMNILQAGKKNRAEKILVTSTSEVYGTAKYVPIDENHPRQGQSPYSASKIGADYLAQSFINCFNLPVTIVRPFNTYGPRQSARAVIPAIIIQLLNGKNKIKLGSLYPTRDLLFVKDTVEGFIKIAGSDSLTGEEVNIATSSEISISDLAAKIKNMINPSAEIVNDEIRIRPQSSEVERLFGMNDKIKLHTGWNTQYTLEKGLTETIEWFKDKGNLLKYKSDLYNI